MSPCRCAASRKPRRPGSESFENRLRVRRRCLRPDARWRLHSASPPGSAPSRRKPTARPGSRTARGSASGRRGARPECLARPARTAPAPRCRPLRSRPGSAARPHEPACDPALRGSRRNRRTRPGVRRRAARPTCCADSRLRIRRCGAGTTTPARRPGRFPPAARAARSTGSPGTAARSARRSSCGRRSAGPRCARRRRSASSRS